MKALFFRLSSVFLMLILLAAGCDSEENKAPCLPDYGMEDGYFYWFENEKKNLKRDRNHLSIRFYEASGKAFHDSILEKYGIKTVWAQTYDKHPPMPGYYKGN
ncbi:hypothetical protein [Alkalitalea saponilacus]|uniref:hypothetical protein n=1 Tax=Alkalitalea saponilacus TaxID=889453 RepID=UPI0009A65C2D|nr:hypothetical protein [Alkalitalea saponilacus]ASB48226.1 hypothetical protein CDL62_03255 [Alkalitalea saponilacus]